MTRSRRTVALGTGLVLVVALVAGGGFLALRDPGASEPPKAPLQAQLIEWNLSGYSLHKGALAPADRLVQEVAGRDPRPIAVATVETCSDQFDHLRRQLAPLGYSAAANWSIPAFSRPGCGSFGNAVFWRGDVSPDGVQRLTYPAATQAEGAATQEQRNLLCVAFTVPETTGTAATPMRVCATHLHRDPRFAALQASVALRTLEESNRTGPPTFLLGDLNLLPGSAALSPWYAAGRYVEADRSTRERSRPTTTGRVPFKYDYVFAPSETVDIPAPADILPVPAFGDHAILVAHVAFRTTPPAG